MSESSLVAGRYRLHRLLGRGGSSEVYSADDKLRRRLPRPV